MTIPSTARRAGPYYGTAAQTVWPFAFKVFDPADIAVIFTSSTGVESTLVLNSDYSVTLNANQDTSPGGAVVYPLTGSPMAPGNRLTIVGDLDYDQPLDLPDGGNFNPVAMENELDRIVMQVQQLHELLQRAITISASSEPTTDTMLPAPGPFQLIGWNQTGSGLQNYDPSDLVVTGLYADWVYDTFTGNGTTTTFGLQRAPGAVGNTDVSVDGQTYVPNIDFTVTGTNLIFNVAPVTGAQILVRYGSAAPQGPVASIYLKHEEKIAAAGQTVFSLTNGYQPGIGTMSAYVNGVRMTPGYDYLETNSTTVTFSSGLKAGDRVLFITGVEVTTGTPGRGITSVVRTSGTGAPGTTDTYTITYSDATTSTFQVYNGANGTGTGDVVGPASATNNNFVAFNTTTGKLIKDSGSKASDFQPTLVSGTNIKTVNGSSLLGSGDLAVSGGGAAFKNRIINGKMDIAQRGTSFAAIASGAYSLDRWSFGNTSSAVGTISQQSDVPSNNEFQNSLRFAVTTIDSSIAAGDIAWLQQKIEGFNVRDLIGKTFTLSFWVRSSKTGTHCVSFANAGGTTDRVYVTEYTISAANTWELKTVTVSGGLITAGNWNWTNGVGLVVQFALASGSTYNTTANAWQTGVFVATSNQVNCLDTVGNIFAITGVQLEVGSVATPFEHRPYGAELALCQRYLPAFNGATIIGAGWCASATQAYVEVNHGVTPRVAPTGLTTSAVGSFTIYGSGGTSVTPTSVTLNAGGTSGSRISVVTASGLAAGIGTGFYANSASSQLLFTGCEL